MIKNRLLALVFRIGILVVILLGILINLGVFRGTFQLGAMMFYTIQSNLLALVLFAVLSFRTISDIKKNGFNGETGYIPRFKFVCIVNLLLTMVVYWTLLAPQMFEMSDVSPIWSFGNLSVHLIAPLGCLLDYILFTKPKGLKYRDVYATLIFPAAYLIFASVAGLMGYTYKLTASGSPSHYPYPFMDYDRIGARAIIYIAAMMIGILAVAHVIYFIDRKVESRGKSHANHKI